MIEDLTNKIEALLFSAARTISIEEIEEIIGIRDKNSIKKAINELQERHKNGSLIIIEEKEGYRFTIKEKYMDIVSKVVEDTELNKAVMETLAVIAWKSPVLQSEIIKIRSNKAYDHISELKDNDFITKEKFGRSYKLRLAPKFYEYFDIRNKEDIKEKFNEVEKKAEEEREKKIGEWVEEQQKEKSIEESLSEIREDIEKGKKELEKRKEEEKPIEINKKAENIEIESGTEKRLETEGSKKGINKKEQSDEKEVQKDEEADKKDKENIQKEIKK